MRRTKRDSTQTPTSTQRLAKQVRFNILIPDPHYLSYPTLYWPNPLTVSTRRNGRPQHLGPHSRKHKRPTKTSLPQPTLPNTPEPCSRTQSPSKRNMAPSSHPQNRDVVRRGKRHGAPLGTRKPPRQHPRPRHNKANTPWPHKLQHRRKLALGSNRW